MNLLRKLLQFKVKLTSLNLLHLDGSILDRVQWCFLNITRQQLRHLSSEKVSFVYSCIEESVSILIKLHLLNPHEIEVVVYICLSFSVDNLIWLDFGGIHTIHIYLVYLNNPFQMEYNYKKTTCSSTTLDLLEHKKQHGYHIFMIYQSFCLYPRSI